jgi:alpha-1,2-mannosyltransferase
MGSQANILASGNSTPAHSPWCPQLFWAAAFASAGLLAAYYCLVLACLPQMDLRVYRMGGQHVFGGDLYSSHITALGRHLVFTYPPVSAALFWPFSFFSSHASQVIWDAIDVVALAALVAVSIAAARRRPIATSDWRAALLLLAPIGLLLWPVRYNLNLGQINIVLALMIVTDLTVGLSWRTKEMPKGILVGFACAIKLTPLVFVVYLVATHQWRAARNAAVTFALVTGLMFAAAPGASWVYFTKDVFEVSRVGNDRGIGNQTLLAALYRSHLALPSYVTDFVLFAVLCAGVALATVAYRRSSEMLGLLVCATTVLMISPISWPHYYVWIVPVLIWLAVGTDRPAKGGWWAAASAFVFVIIPPFHVSTGVVWYVWENAYVLAALAFLGLTGAMIWARARSRSPWPVPSVNGFNP